MTVEKDYKLPTPAQMREELKASMREKVYKLISDGERRLTPDEVFKEFAELANRRRQEVARALLGVDTRWGAWELKDPSPLIVGLQEKYTEVLRPIIEQELNAFAAKAMQEDSAFRKMLRRYIAVDKGLPYDARKYVDATMSAHWQALVKSELDSWYKEFIGDGEAQA